MRRPICPITWPEFAEIHPFVPPDQAIGYAELIKDLSEKLCKITGYDAISMQPNSGAQGEFAGLLAIRAYHKSRGEAHRNVCLIPASAHGTNPASASMCGMKVVVVATTRTATSTSLTSAPRPRRTRKTSRRVMIYPSTHGVFEECSRNLRVRVRTGAKCISTAPI